VSKEKGFLSTKTIKVLTKRDLVSALHGWGIYVATVISFLLSSFFLGRYLGGIREDNIRISLDPLSGFLFFPSVIIISFYLTILSSIAVSRERDQGTLEILFYGPVNSSAFILAKYLKEMLTYLIIVIFFFAYFWGVSGLTNLGFSYGLAKAIFLSIFLVSCWISFGLFISSLTSRVRNSILWVVGVFLALWALYFGQGLLLSLSTEEMPAFLSYIGGAVSFIYQAVWWISPLSYLSRGMDAVNVGSGWLYGMSILYSIIYSVVLIILSIFILKRKGVRG
jgi:ABC-type transport system involved in multi-copper enzyme maturation permease subunit